MQKLDLDGLAVETFATQDLMEQSDPGVTQGPECTVTLIFSCTCNYHTVRYDCV